MEGRRHKRKQIHIGCWILGEDGGCNCCSSFDLSDSGVSISTDEPLSVGQVVSLQFYTTRSAAPLTLSAEVVWSRIDPDGLMGLRFIDITQDDLSVLRDIIRQKIHRERNTSGLSRKI
jgi:hypothetical protein